MPRPTRILARESLLALLIAYLREGVTTTANFATYPTTQRLWTFSLGSDLWQLRISEEGLPPLSPGVTIEFAGDAPADNQGMPQVWKTTARVRIRVPWESIGDNIALQIAAKIDEALHRSGGATPIKDYFAVPVSDTGKQISWQEERGAWEQQAVAGLLTDWVLELPCTYTTATL